MRLLIWLAAGLIGILQPVQQAAQPSQPPVQSVDQSAGPQRRVTMSELMVKVIYPSSDAVFYISTRTPKDDAGWRALESSVASLAQAADALMKPPFARDQERWVADAKLLVDASLAAIAAAKTRDVDALASLNDSLYASCVTCHQHYRPNYGRRAIAPTAPAPARSGAIGVPAERDPGAGAPRVDRTADGQPDLEGVWSFATLAPLERPAEFADREFVSEEEATAWARQTIERNDRDRRDGGANADVGRAVNDYWFERGTSLAKINGRIRTSLIVDPPNGRLPELTAEARARAADRAADNRQHPADGPENRSLQERCLSFNAGPPILPGPYNNYVQILQTADYVIIFNEMIHDARLVPLDGRPHVAPVIRKWLGDSRGRWEGETLVVDTTNFTDKTPLRESDEQLHLVERFTRRGADTLLYEFVVEDPSAFSATWTVQLPMTKTTDRIFEYACHEGNYALEDILRGARAQDHR